MTATVFKLGQCLHHGVHIGHQFINFHGTRAAGTWCAGHRNPHTLLAARDAVGGQLQLAQRAAPAPRHPPARQQGHGDGAEGGDQHAGGLALQKARINALRFSLGNELDKGHVGAIHLDGAYRSRQMWRLPPSGQPVAMHIPDQNAVGNVAGLGGASVRWSAATRAARPTRPTQAGRWRAASVRGLAALVGGLLWSASARLNRPADQFVHQVALGFSVAAQPVHAGVGSGSAFQQLYETRQLLLVALAQVVAKTTAKAP